MIFRYSYSHFTERLVGKAIAHTMYQESLASPQTGRIRIVFEENTGLANIVPADVIRKLLNRPEIAAFEPTFRTELLNFTNI